ncbi:YkgJ family cysteine cluster protein [Fervidicoccus fontis]|uniref:YkgJ family cysteine cluster protein n=1 Tax=Fervidicoccus fontis TaxID=683846 RepID=A0A2J6N9Q6_9CREN|nr:YkgJ family cysteine cluster protein [Fervidicoccus fontis]PMB75355.1 MAG: YkgJ family cysteine cluster protein [Fervidicoccus fontis]PMB75505.1 MAG: YkgJ family cysteine cluster protein [Fervidicoccus fontis]PMB76247.1 MAG: YkgJ family cysteine cluster protein [Fervidicoccus fontis]PMB78060.1 MAG: YkgJ family cysteine cluster protein [Fervidicoccus fontis]HEW64218.1 YkgJ family cysteine cluster protein [Fervidicoccus fontis]
MNNMNYIRVGEKFKFKCTRCTLCCGTGPNVSITVFDVIRMSKYLDVNPIQFLKIFTNVIIADLIPVIALKGDIAGRCEFLGFDSNGKTFCKIYKYRPLKCRLYPIKLISPKSNYVYLDTDCPGLYAEDAEFIDFPVDIYKRNAYEVEWQYKKLYEKIFNEGKEPLNALLELIEELYEEAKNKNPSWLEI